MTQIHLKKVQSSGFFYVKGKWKWEGQDVIDYQRHTGASKGLRKIVDPVDPS